MTKTALAEPDEGLQALQLAALSPASFAHVVSGGAWVPFEHLIKLDEYLGKVEAGEIDRLIVTCPPRHGKSELISRYLPAWYLGRHPDQDVMLICYDQELAEDHGAAARDLLTQWGPVIWNVRVEDRGAGRWRVAGHKGAMFSKPMRAGITGKGAHLMIIDDPVKDEEAAQSERAREKAWTWWQATARTRLQLLGGSVAVILVMTRWHEDDLAAKLIEGGGWTVLNMPAIAEEDDAIGREVGEALCPELIDLGEYERLKREVGSYFFAALYQQKPAPAEGIMFKRKDMRWYRVHDDTVSAHPVRWYLLPHEDGEKRVAADSVTTFQTVDVAISDKETADWTVVATWAATPEKDLLLLDIERRHFEQQQVIPFLKAANDKHGRPRMYVERFGAGRSPLKRLSEDGYPVSEIPAEAGTQQNKTTRAFGAVAAYERHAVFHPMPYPDPDWLTDYEEELISFPHAKHDDQVDAVAYACRLLPKLGGFEWVAPYSGKPLGAGIMTAKF